ncbi:MAG: outer rane immunogenic protein [Alphaproteobacteria bacterium]|nr:outer rane immunogenic protein [Alphaproteobacteria bacterium]
MRRSMLLLLSSASLVLAASQLATAADLTPRYKAQSAEPAWSWTGLYVGVHVGSSWGTVESELPIPGIGPFAAASGTINGFLGGGQIGYNWQTGPLVLGLEADASWTDIKGTSPCLVLLNCQRKVESLGTVAGRLGFTADHALVYVKGGLAWANFKYNTSLLGIQVASADQSEWAPMVGVGIEYSIMPNWSAKAEYNYLGFDKNTVPFAIVGGGAANVNVTQSIHTMKFGVNYRFGGMPLVASY